MMMWKKIGRLLSNAILIASIMCCVFVLMQRASGSVMPSLFGFGAGAVQSGSMEPAIMTGDFVITHKEDSNMYSVGDVVMYETPDIGIVMHRIVNANDTSVQMQGDANNAVDNFEAVGDNGWIERDQIITRVVFNIPGHVYRYTVVIAGLLAAFLAGCDIGRSMTEKKYRINWIVQYE